jgi:glycosyltransferase involved in cell wall biosynthesis
MPIRDIICISTHYWHGFWYRKQQFMSRLAERGFRILYVQPSHSIVRRPDPPGIARNGWFRPRLEQIGERVFLLYPPRLFPKYMHPWVAPWNYRWFGRLIGREVVKLGMRDACLWMYRPDYVVSLDRIPHSKLVFDMVDDLTAYEATPRHRRYVGRCINELTRRADLTVVTSSTLAESVSHNGRCPVVVPNGYDERIFDGRAHAVPADLARLPRPVVGFVGVLFGFLDYELLLRLTDAMPNVSFVFVGPVDASGKDGVERLRTRSNTYFLGSKPRTDIPAYVGGFDLCINPFKVDDVARSVSPLKVYEYLACGKRVVSTPMEGFTRDAPAELVDFASPERFSATVREALVHPGGRARDPARIHAARAFSWSRQFEKLEPHVLALLGS